MQIPIGQVRKRGRPNKMLNNVLDHSARVKIPRQHPNIPGHMVTDAVGPKRKKMWRPLYLAK